MTSKSIKMLAIGTLLGCALSASVALAAETPNAQPEPQLSDEAVVAEVSAVVEKFGQYMTDLADPKPVTLFDRDDPKVMYLAEEMPDWIVGWDKLDWYYYRPDGNAMVDAMDYTPSNIRVRSLSNDLAIATWFVWAEYKFKNGPPIGEHLRAQGILRKTADGWKFIYYSESPKSTMTYMRDLYEAMATPAFRERFGATPDKRTEFGVGE